MASKINVDLKKNIDNLMKVLDERSRDVMTRRYGLNKDEPETLEAIGREYGITRERVRQIQSQAKKALVGLKHLTDPATDLINEVFLAYGSVLTEENAVTAIAEFAHQDLGRNAVVFYLDVLPPYRLESRHSLFQPHWRLPDMVSSTSESVIEEAINVLRQYNHPLPESEIVTMIRTNLKADDKALPERHILAFLTASKDIDKTPFAEWGLLDWSETKPRGVGDKAYVVMRRHKNPEHFTKITELINAANFDHKRANAQTVHNELIKDKRFVLVGRGLYGLAEWGYIAGTVSDVIEKLLTEANTPLTRDEVVKRVLNQRQVKKNTILLGLQNHKRFRKTAENRYTLRRP